MRYFLLAIAFFLFPTSAFALTTSAVLESASSQYLTAGDTASLSITGPLTIETRYKFVSLPTTDEEHVFAWKWAGSNQRTYWFSLQNSGGTYQFRFSACNNGSGSVCDTENVAWTPSTGVWYNVAVTFEPGSPSVTKFYVNGVQQGSTQTGSVASMSNTSAPFEIGGNSGGLYADGKFSVFRVWNVIRTEAELEADMCVVYGAPESGMAAEWNLDTDLTDSSGNSNTLTDPNGSAFDADVPSCDEEEEPPGEPDAGSYTYLDMAGGTVLTWFFLEVAGVLLGFLILSLIVYKMVGFAVNIFRNIL